MTDNGTKRHGMKPSTATVSGTVIGGPTAVLIVWAARQFHGIEIPGEVAAAIGTLVGAVVGWASNILLLLLPPKGN
jgi:uncharacterized membrane protein YfcA